MAQRTALEGLPDEQKQAYIDNLQRVAQYELSEQGTRNGGLAGVATTGQQMIDANKDLLTADANARRDNQRYLGTVQSEHAGYTDKAFEYNKDAPYKALVTAASANQGAGIQNISRGLNSAASTLAASSLYGGTGDTGMVNPIGRTGTTPVQYYDPMTIAPRPTNNDSAFELPRQNNPYGWNQEYNIPQYQ